MRLTNLSRRYLQSLPLPTLACKLLLINGNCSRDKLHGWHRLRQTGQLPGSEFKSVLAQLIPATPLAPEMARLSASFFSFLFDRAESVTGASSWDSGGQH